MDSSPEIPPTAPKAVDFGPLVRFLKRLPSVKWVFPGVECEDGWELEVELDLDHGLAWAAVQELSYVLNVLSKEEDLPTRFLPVSPSPLENGGPRDHLKWLIVAFEATFSPASCYQRLLEHLPNPVDDVSEWPDVEH